MKSGKVDKSFEKEGINCVALIGVAAGAPDFSCAYFQRTSELRQTRFIQIYKNSKFHHSFRTRSGATTDCVAIHDSNFQVIHFVGIFRK